MNAKDLADAGKSATLTVGSNQQTHLPVRSGTIGPDVIDVGRLYRDTGCFTYDPGFTSTANCSSRITYIDGDKGVLLYRGYPIEQLAQRSSFLEVCYVLLYGDLPTKTQYENFRNIVTRHTMVHEQMTRFFTGFRRDAHPMAVMCGSVGALSAFYHDSTDIRPQQRMIASHRLIAKMLTLAASGHKYSIGQPSSSAQRSRLRELPADVLCGAVRALCGDDRRRAPSELDPARRSRAERFDLHRAAGLGANPFACIAAGIARGVPAPTRPPSRCSRRSAPSACRVRQEGQGQELRFRLMGFGHRPELRSARQGDARDHEVLILGGGPTHPRVAMESAHRPQDTTSSRKALPQHRLLLGDHTVGDGLPAVDVHGAVRGGAHGGLGGAVERDDRGSRAEDRPARQSTSAPPSAPTWPSSDGASATTLSC
jgi:citrate synthase